MIEIEKTIRNGALVLAVAFLSFAGFAYAHDPRYDERNHTYRAGQAAGFDQGNADQQEKRDFNFRHDAMYETSSHDRRNDPSRLDVNFRLGYVEGYADGYFKRNHSYDLRQQQRSKHYNQNDQRYGYPYESTVTVYTRTEFRGDSKKFGVGRYPNLQGRLDDDIQSVQVNGSVRVILFEDNQFRGKRIILDTDSQDLGNFRKKTGSIVIEPLRYSQFQ